MAKKTAKKTTKKKTSKAVKLTGRQALLAKLGELAKTPGVDLVQVADRLGMTPAAFEKMLTTDTEAGRTWRHAKTDALVEAGEILWGLANDGNTAAARQIIESMQSTMVGADTEAMTVKDMAALLGETTNRLDYWFRKHGMPKNLDKTISLKAFLNWYGPWLIEQHTFDPNRVKLKDLEPLLGVTRQAINEWLKEGLPRNTDAGKTFSLAAVFAWRMERLSNRPSPKGEAPNELRDKKAERLQIDIDKQKKNLLPREAVELGLIARMGVLIQFLDRKGRELPGLLAGQPAEDIQDVLSRFFDELKTAAADVPDEIAEALPADRADAVRAALGILNNKKGGE